MVSAAYKVRISGPRIRAARAQIAERGTKGARAKDEMLDYLRQVSDSALSPPVALPILELGLR